MSRVPVVFTIRFSVLQANPNAWIMGRNRSFEDYRDELFNEERLDIKSYLFENVTLPSLLNQTASEDVHVAVITSTELPQKYADRLLSLASKHPRVSVVFGPPDRGIDHRTPLGVILRENRIGLYAHARIDDDDAIASNYVERLQKYATDANVGMGVSFGQGYCGVFDHDAGLYQDFRHLYYPKLALGLATINRYDVETDTYASPIRTAYELGSHTKADVTAPIIIDSREPAFIYSLHGAQDTFADPVRIAKEKASADDVVRRFALTSRVVHLT